MLFESWTIGIFLFVVGTYKVVRAYLSFRRARLVGDTERSTTSAAAVGGVELEGFAWPLVKPFETLRGGPAIFRILRVEESTETKNGGTTWVEKVKDEQWLPFFVVDKGGAAYVMAHSVFLRSQPKNQKTLMWEELDSQQRELIRNEVIKDKLPALEQNPKKFRVVEHSFLVGHPVYVRGLFKGETPALISDAALCSFHYELFGSSVEGSALRFSQTSDLARYTTALAEEFYRGTKKLASDHQIYRYGVVEISSLTEHFVSDVKEDELIAKVRKGVVKNFLVGAACLALVTTNIFLWVMKTYKSREVANVIEVAVPPAQKESNSQASKGKDSQTKIVVSLNHALAVLEMPKSELLFASFEAGYNAKFAGPPHVWADRFLLFVRDDGWGDGDKFVSADLWDLEEKRIVSRWFQPGLLSVTPVGLSAEKFAGLVGETPPRFVIWDRKAQKVDYQKVLSTADPDSLQSSPGGQLIAFTATTEGNPTPSWYVWDEGLQKLQIEHSAYGYPKNARFFKPEIAKSPSDLGLRSAVFSQDGRYAVGLMNDVNDLIHADLVSGKLTKFCSYFCVKEGDLRSAGLSLDGRWFYLPETKRIWDTSSGQVSEFKMSDPSLREHDVNSFWNKKDVAIDPELCLTISAKCWSEATKALLNGNTNYGYALMRGVCRAGKREACALSNTPNPREGDDRPSHSTRYKREDFHTLRDYIEFLRSPHSSHPPVKSKKAD